MIDERARCRGAGVRSYEMTGEFLSLPGVCRRDVGRVAAPARPRSPAIRHDTHGTMTFVRSDQSP
jgi:hypothetical protein